MGVARHRLHRLHRLSCAEAARAAKSSIIRRPSITGILLLQLYF